MPYRGACVHLLGGAIQIHTDDVSFPQQFGYGRNEDFLKIFVLSYTKFLCDSPLESSTMKPAKVIMKFFRRLISEDIRHVIKEFSRYSDIILSSEYGSGSDSTTRVFHDFMRGTPIFKEYHQWVMTGRPELLTYVLSFLRFGKKLEYEDPELDATAFRGWLQVEEKLKTLELNDKDTASLRTIVRRLVGRLQVDHLLPKFGGGKVSERHIEDVYDKIEFLAYDKYLEYAFMRGPYGLRGEGFGPSKVIQHRVNSNRISRLKFVPKDISKSRSICMEPNAYMYFQQEVLRWMRNSMDRSPISRFVTLEDQSLNREGAMHGSTYLCSDTIDLSSASDSVSVELVRRIFPRDWLYYMLATRSSSVRVKDGSVIPVRKFAPMGSAVCFPTQCIIFTAVCVYAYAAVVAGQTTGDWVCTDSDYDAAMRQMCGRDESTPFGKRYEAPRVYGDDIIVDSRTTSEVISALQRLGFDVNVAKSFTGSMSFRESCGIYAYLGQDVTPFQFRLPFIKKGWVDANQYASLIEGVNQAKSKGYHALATFWMSLLEGLGLPYPVPYTENDTQFGIYVTRKGSVALKHLRWNANWQTFEERVMGIGPTKLRNFQPDKLDEYKLDQWWRSRVRGNSTLLPETGRKGGLRIRPQETRLVPRWTRCEV